MHTTTHLPAKKALLLCALSLMGTGAFAQKGFDLGLNTVIQTSSLLNSQDQAAGEELNFKQKVSAAFGIEGNYSFNNHMGIGLGFLYSKQVQGYTGTIVDPLGTDAKVYSTNIEGESGLNGGLVTGAYTADVTLTYIKIPILFKYTGNKTKKVYFNSFIGPQIDILSNTVFHVNGTEMPLTGTSSKPTDMYNKTGFSGVLGVGAGWNITKMLVLTAELRLDYGFGDAENKSATINVGSGPDKFWGDGRGTTNTATGGLMIGLNYRFIKDTKATTKTTTKTTTTTKKK